MWTCHASRYCTWYIALGILHWDIALDILYLIMHLGYYNSDIALGISHLRYCICDIALKMLHWGYFTWDITFGILHLICYTWDIALGILLLGYCTWNIILDIVVDILHFSIVSNKPTAVEIHTLMWKSWGEMPGWWKVFWLIISDIKLHTIQPNAHLGIYYLLQSRQRPNAELVPTHRLWRWPNVSATLDLI